MDKKLKRLKGAAVLSLETIEEIKAESKKILKAIPEKDYFDTNSKTGKR